MEGNRGFASLLFQGEECLGEMLVVPQEDADPSFIQHLFGSRICFSFFSPTSERGLHPLTSLPSIASPPGPLFKMCSTEAQMRTDSLRLDLLHKACLEESKTAVVLLDNGNELHLVAMGAKAGGNLRVKHCFWAFLAREGMYASCLGMLNLRCLAMVFDLDETLIVANTMRSFENRIEVLDRRLCGSTSEMDPVRRNSLIAELKRYQEDRDLLKQFVDNDQIFDNGNILEAQGEVVPPLADGALPLVRPIIRLPDRNLVLTRINPSVRDTSVLVRLRPAWEELRGYLIAKGRKRFEVYICTMAEREYALEMWRLLDPDAGLINSRELMERVVCVKSGNKKSLVNVFPHHRCHPKLAMVVDDRVKVWEESDQPQVHVVPAFAPYSAPHAETGSSLTLPALRVAKNVVCNVRAAFFKHFDEDLSQLVPEVQFETEVSSVPMPLAISTCLQAAEAKNNFGHLPSFRTENEEMRSAVNPISPQTVQPVPTQAPSNALPLLPTEIISHPLTPEDSRPADVLPESFNAHGGDLLLPHHQQPAALLRNVIHSNSAQSSSPVREEEGEVPESELDPDTRRRLLILQHGMDTNHTRELQNFDERTPFTGSGNIPAATTVSSFPGGEEEMSPGRPTRTSTEPLSLKPESPSFDSKHDLHDLQGPPGFADGPYLSNHDRSGGPQDPRRRLPQDSNRFLLDDMKPQTRSDAFSDQQKHSFLAQEETQSLNSRNLVAPGLQELQLLHARRQQQQQQQPTNYVEVLQSIAQKLSANVEYKGSLASSSTRLLFNVEVTFGGQKVGEGTGSTKKEARFKAAEAALWFLARKVHPDMYALIQQQLQLSSAGLGGSNPRLVDDDAMLSVQGSSRDTPRLRPPGLMGSLATGSLDRGLDMDYLEVANPAGQINFVAILKERCTILGVNVNFQDLPTTGDASRRFFNCHVEVDRQVLGKGSGLSWEIAKQHAAEEALRQLKRIDTPRSPPVVTAKRVRMGFSSAPSPPSRGGRRGRGRGRSPPRRRPPGQ